MIRIPTGAATPLPYQEEGIALIDRYNGRALLADEMGLGKTLQALWALQRKPERLPALIVCPASVKYNWQREAEIHCGMMASICEGQSPPTFNRMNRTHISQLTIINYDILKYWLDYLKKLNFQTVIFDESQYLQSRTSDRTKASRKIVKGVPHVFALSGTPLTNRPAELFPILNILWPTHYNSFFSFAELYCEPKWKPWGTEFKGATNLPQLHAELKERGMIRRLKVDVLKDLPEKNRRTQLMDLSDPAEYRKASTDFMSWLRENHAHKVRRASRAEKLVQVGYLLRIAARLKMRSVVGWANKFLRETDEKLILFAVHTKAIELLQRRVEAKSVTIDGSVTGRRRELAKDQFQRDPKTRLMIANIKAGGVGLTLTASSTVGFTELWWRPGDHIQAEDRIHRIGQTKVSWIYYLIAGGTIEERLCRILQEKQAVISAVLDGGPVAADLNIYEELLDELEKEVAV